MRSPLRAALSAAALACALAPLSAAAQSKQECADAYIAAQVARKDGHLREAHDKLSVCASAACPAALRRDCVPWLEQVDKDLPRLAVTATSSAGAPVDGAHVSIDGAPIEAGGAAPVDPGEHVIRVEATGMKPGEQRVRVAAGDGRRDIAVRLDPDGSASPPSPRPIPVAPIAFGAVGVIGLGAFAALGSVGNGRKSHLDAIGCKPNCARRDVDNIKALYVSADVSLGVGLASLVTAGVLLIMHVTAPRSSPPAEARVSFAPRRGGGEILFRF